jgi:hypothetical protein
LDQEIPVLSIGSVVGGPDAKNQPWTDAITELTRNVASARPGTASPLRVNVIFHVPGELLEPEFTGVRTGHFSKRDSLLLVQVALPRKPPEDLSGFLKAAAQAAVDEAERWAQRKGIARDLNELHAILELT